MIKRLLITLGAVVAVAFAGIVPAFASNTPNVTAQGSVQTLVGFKTLPPVIDFGSMGPGALGSASEAITYVCSASGGCNVSVIADQLSPTWSNSTDQTVASNAAVANAQTGFAVNSVPIVISPLGTAGSASVDPHAPTGNPASGFAGTLTDAWTFNMPAAFAPSTFTMPFTYSIAGN